jgi:hypothetical protein
LCQAFQGLALCAEFLLIALFSFAEPLLGVDLRVVANEMEQLLKRAIKDIPSIKANLLIQYKRPKFIQKANGKEWVHWNEPYFRYDINPSQQILLAHLHQKFGSKALVMYASPAVPDTVHLVNLKQQNKIIESTNFCKSISLSGHHRNTYTEAGLHSIACSDPVQLERFDLIKELEKLPILSSVDPIKFITEFSETVRNVCLADQTVSTAFSILVKDSDSLYSKEHPVLYALGLMESFREITGIQWLIATASEKTHNL